MRRSTICVGFVACLIWAADASASLPQRPYSVSAVRQAFASQLIKLGLIDAGAGGSSYEIPILAGTLGNLSVVVSVGPDWRGGTAPHTARFWRVADSTMLNDQYRGRAVGVFGNLAITVSYLSEKSVPHRHAAAIPGRVTAALLALQSASATTTRAVRVCRRLARVPIPGGAPAAAATCSGMPHVRAAAYTFFAKVAVPRPLGALITYHVYGDAELARRARRTDFSGAEGFGARFIGRLAGLGVPSRVSTDTGYDTRGRAYGQLYVSVLVDEVSATIEVESRTHKPPDPATVRPAVTSLVAHLRAVESGR